VTEGDRFVGAVSLHDIKSYLNAPELAELVIAEDIIRHGFPVVRPEASLAEAMGSFVDHDGERLPVVNSADHCLIGSISKTDVILALAGSSRSSATVRSFDDQ
jgi:CIC family chloride channel protein